MESQVLLTEQTADVLRLVSCFVVREKRRKREFRIACAGSILRRLLQHFVENLCMGQPFVNVDK